MKPSLKSWNFTVHSFILAIAVFSGHSSILATAFFLPTALFLAPSVFSPHSFIFATAVFPTHSIKFSLSTVWHRLIFYYSFIFCTQLYFKAIAVFSAHSFILAIAVFSAHSFIFGRSCIFSRWWHSGLMTVSFQPCGKDIVYKKKGIFFITRSVKTKKLETLIIETRKKGCFPSFAKGKILYLLFYVSHLIWKSAKRVLTLKFWSKKGVLFWK